MYRIMRKEILNQSVKLMDIYAPEIARKAEPGQFVMLRVSEDGERIPLTIADFDRINGTIAIIFQEVGKTTVELGMLEEGMELLDFAGPLGKASHFDADVKKAIVVGGGVGTAIAYPQAKKLHSLGVDVYGIIGFRNKDLVILQEQMGKVCRKLHITTDDGSNGNKGFVTDELKRVLAADPGYQLVVAIGPLIMMKMVSAITLQYGVKTIVSMNPVMIDGTGMCGGCRLTVGGKTVFACVDGPDFDGHQVDFDEAMRRQSFYGAEEKTAKEHICRLEGRI